MTLLALFASLALSAPTPEIPDPPCHVRDAAGFPKPCPEADAAVVRAYAKWSHGATVAHVRLSLGTATTRVKVGQPVRVLHVMESLDKAQLWVMGPKEIAGLVVDGLARGPASPEGPEPWVSGTYDGAVVPGPGMDSNFEITELAFDKPGRHTVRWQLGRWRSNTLTFVVE